MSFAKNESLPEQAPDMGSAIPKPNLTCSAFAGISGVMRCVVVFAISRTVWALAASLMLGCWSPAVAQEVNGLEAPASLTNLFLLRQSAEKRPLVLPTFRIVAEVVDFDAAAGVLTLRDASGIEFVQFDLGGRTFEPGETVCLEGQGYRATLKGFGLAVIPGMVVDNDGIHGMMTETGATFLHAGRNPIAVQWFNHLGELGLNVEYEGPHLPRQPIPNSVLSRAQVEAGTGVTNFIGGLDYRCYEGCWVQLPAFAENCQVKSGVVTNFDLGVRSRHDDVALEFSGFISIPRDGWYTFYVTSDDGGRLFVGEPSLDIRILSHGLVPPAANKVPATIPERNNRPWVTLEGTVSFAGVLNAGGLLTMRTGSDDIRVGVLKGGVPAPEFPPSTRVRASGIYQDVVTGDGSPGAGMLLVSSWNAIHPVPLLEKALPMVSGAGETTTRSAREDTMVPAALPAISTVAKIKGLPPDLARQQLPVSIRGVVTAILPAFIRGAVVQDSTKGIYVSFTDMKEPPTLQLGGFYQIDGATGPGLFAPVVAAHNMTFLGAGQLPQPLHATWDQLINGSLDTQYAEIDGVVTAIHGQELEMLAEGGKITIELGDFQGETLTGYLNALVRIRGCAFAFFNEQTHELAARSLRMLGGAVEILQAAPRDLFDAPQRSIGELLLYDPKAAPFRPLKVSGQVLYSRAGEYFVTDGTNGMHITARKPEPLAVGELVDAVGFLELGGPAVELKEAVIRKTGRGPLRPPTRLAHDQLLLARYAGTLVQVDAILMNYWRDGSDYVLDLQSGFLAFRARVVGRGQFVSLPPSGSRLELTGVYAPQGNRAADGTVSGFELLLRSPEGIRVLATPSWWTLKRVLMLTGVFAVLLLAVLVWNKELQLKVQERGRQLEAEIRNRRQAELRQAAEAERARIARDLHDELGTGLTEVSLLAGMGVGAFREAEKNNDRFRAIAEKARALVSGLDVIVWAIDPRRNSLQSFADYLGRYATEFFSASDIVCRFNIPIECDAVTLTESARHSLFLAVKEALNNVIRHAQATEVEMQISQCNDSLKIVIADNGRGFDGKTIRRGNGLTNLRERLQALNGQCRIESQVGKGTSVEFTIPLPCDPRQVARLSTNALT